MLFFSHSIMLHNLKPHGLQHPRLPYPLPSPEAYSNSCPLSQWCCLTISSFVVPFSCLPSFPASWSFPMSWLFVSHGQSIGASAWAPVYSMNRIFRVDFLSNQLVWSPCSPRDTEVFSSTAVWKHLSSTTIWKHQFLGLSCLYGPTLKFIHDYWKNHSVDYMDLCWQSNDSHF